MKNQIYNKCKKKNIYRIYLILIIILIILLLKKIISKINIINYDFFFKKLFCGEVDKLLIKHHVFVSVWIKNKFNNFLIKDKYPLIKRGLFIFSLEDFSLDIGDIQYFENLFSIYRNTYNLDSIFIFKNKERYKIKRFIFYYLLFFVFTFYFGSLLHKQIVKKVEESNSNQILNFGKTKAKIYYEKINIDIKFNDIAGLVYAKKEIGETVEFLKKTTKYTILGGRMPRGILLIGPPGTGKTLLAKAVAGEAQVPFFVLSGSDFIEMFVGIGASRVRDLFHQAKAKSPSIIFIDEIDSIGRTRHKNYYINNDERENTLNQLLTEMDGFNTNTNVIIIAASNRSDILDKALLRPGRFDRIIFVDLPDLKERREIFLVHIKNLLIAKNVDLCFLARQTLGFSGADIAHICNEAALIAARKFKTKIEHNDFLAAIDRIISGLEKKNKIIKFSEKRRIAYHEAGHAILSWLLEHSAPLVRVTIIPRGKSLGSAWYTPNDRQLSTLDQILDQMCILLGGRAAEQIIFGNISTGSLNDLEFVTKQAKSIVIIFGLNKRIGNISYYDSTVENKYTLNKHYSEYTAYIIDKEISKIIEEQFQRSRKLLENNRRQLINIANKLLEKEVLLKNDIENVFGQRHFIDNKIDDFFEKY